MDDTSQIAVHCMKQSVIWAAQQELITQQFTQQRPDSRLLCSCNSNFIVKFYKYVLTS